MKHYHYSWDSPSFLKVRGFVRHEHNRGEKWHRHIGDGLYGYGRTIKAWRRSKGDRVRKHPVTSQVF